MKSAFALALCMLFLSCATTKITSIRDDEFPQLTYDRILVLSFSEDLELEQGVETAFCESLEKEGVDAFKAIEYWSPLKRQKGIGNQIYSDEAYNRLFTTLEDNNIVAVLFVVMTDAWSDYRYVHTPERITTEGSAQSWGDGRWMKYQSESYSSGGSTITIEKLRRSWKVSLIDFSSGKEIWLCTAKTRGGRFAGVGTLLRSLASRVVKELKHEGFIATERN